MRDTTTAASFFAHNDWARDKLLELATPLSDAALDRPFEMGCGTLRATLSHLYFAERIWLERWEASGARDLPHERGLNQLDDLASAWRRLSATRNSWITGFAASDFDRLVNYRSLKGDPFSGRLSGLMLHVCNHGVHHRAQAVNMLRHIGVKPPWLDFIARIVEQPAAAAALPPLETLRRLFAYGDWANARLLSAAEAFDAPALGRPFEIGLGTLRDTMHHIRDAEQWWLTNWKAGSGALFPATDETADLPTIRARFEATIAERDAYLNTLSADDVARIVAATPRPGVRREFPLALTAAQLAFHGTHHRAQALNMLRRLGATPPGLDYVLFAREQGW